MQHIDFILNQNVEQLEYPEQVHWLLSIIEWLQMPRDKENHTIPTERIYSVRIKYLMNLLENNPSWKTNFTNSITSLLLKIPSVNLFSEVGLNLDSSFIQDFIKRFEEKFLPQAPLSEDLATLLYEIFPNEDDSLLIEQIDEAVFQNFLALFHSQTELTNSLRESLLISIRVLSIQLLAKTYFIKKEVHEDFSLHNQWPESIFVNTFNKSELQDIDLLKECLRQSTLNIQETYSRMEHLGIRIEMVYLLESQNRRIDRLQSLLNILKPSSNATLPIRQFIAKTINDLHHQRSFFSFFRENLSLLTRKIVIKNSDLGEHYVTFTWKDFFKMLKKACGGGALTSITVYIKILLSTFALSGFIKGILEGLNYALSFLSIQALGWTLATKQPSTTAPYLAESFKKSEGSARAAILAIIRTQFISVLGNVVLVLPISFLISFVFQILSHPLLSSEKARDLISSTQFFGPSILFASFTGVLLFSSSLIAGWFENWTLILKLPNRLQNHQTLIKYFGLNRTKRLCEILAKNANPIAANVSLGFMLGLVPQFLKFFGFPLEVRHVTLASGNFGAALATLIAEPLELYWLLNSIAGLLFIGVINIAVSFSLALSLAAISSQISLKQLGGLLLWGLKLVLTKPWLLVLPPSDKASPH